MKYILLFICIYIYAKAVNYILNNNLDKTELELQQILLDGEQ